MPAYYLSLPPSCIIKRTMSTGPAPDRDIIQDPVIGSVSPVPPLNERVRSENSRLEFLRSMITDKLQSSLESENIIPVQVLDDSNLSIEEAESAEAVRRHQYDAFAQNAGFKDAAALELHVVDAVLQEYESRTREVAGRIVIDQKAIHDQVEYVLSKIIGSR